MLDAHAILVERVPLVRHVARRVDIRRGAPQALVDENAVAGIEPRLLCELDVGRRARADDHEVTLDHAPGLRAQALHRAVALERGQAVGEQLAAISQPIQPLPTTDKWPPLASRARIASLSAIVRR